MNIPLWLWASALLFITLLSIYAYLLWRQVWARQHARAHARQAQQQRLRGDLKVLSSSLLEGQLPLIEGAIRIKVLLDNLDSHLSQTPQCQVFHQIYEATCDVPTHAAWKALSKAQKREYEQRFEHLQGTLGDNARASAQWLHSVGLS